ncbi:MAG: T9SS type A sorting domain-containing protein [Flavobacteriaceae bacterium]|jgi:ELWxxDGT repeat protein|nr:T9SS type A sorting domain-containing protein [Flavobacteriaceae bacterium]
MKNFTKLLFITALCCAFNVNAQFRLVKDVCAGGVNADIKEFAISGGKMFFQGRDYTTGAYLINSTDGTTAGTNSIHFDSENSGTRVLTSNLPFKFYEYNSELYSWGITFTGASPYTHYIYKVSGSSNFATKIYNLTTGFNYTTNGAKLTYPVFLNNEIIYNPLNTNLGQGNVELYKVALSNNAGSLVKDIWLGIGLTDSNPQEMTLFNNKVYFSANEPANGREIWETDGTNVGTVLFANINFNSGSSNPNQFTVVGSKMVFAATNAVTGRELFITDGTVAGTIILNNINPSSGDSNPTSVTKIGSDIYFAATNGTNGMELFKSDLTSVGTIQIKDINPSGDSNPSKFFQFGAEVYFTADDGTNGIELWKTNGTSGGTTLVKNINPSGNSSPDYFTEYNGKLYFTANNGTNGTELWVSDGTTAGTTMLELNPVGDATVTDLIVFNNELFMAADAGDGIGQELWAYQDPTLSINNNQLNGKQVSLYPNPTQNYFQIETTETLSKVEIYSLHGQLVKSFAPQNQYDISDLSSGMYFVNIHANGNSVSKRLIKE